MRKIKSVKLSNDWRDKTHYILAGTKLTNNNTSYWWLADTISIHEDEIREDKTNLFNIEYEPEGFEFVPFGTRGFSGVFDFDKLVKSELNRLANWCDGQCGDCGYSYMIYYCNNTERFNMNSYSSGMIHQGFKFNSQQSVELFITELSKSKNAEYKNYFINLLKAKRL
jgi:hypothetical protein